MAAHPVFTRALQRTHPNISLSQEGSSTLRASSGERYFIKIGSLREIDQYVGEAESLKAINIAAPGLAPTLIDFGIIDKDSKRQESDVGKPYFISEFKDMGSLSTPAAKMLGERLATEMHAYKSPNGKFGFHVPTYCGATKQDNGWFATWTECFDALIGGLVDKLKAQGGYDALCQQASQVRRR